jgi:hypothetical protein
MFMFIIHSFLSMFMFIIHSFLSMFMFIIPSLLNPSFGPSQPGPNDKPGLSDKRATKDVNNRRSAELSTVTSDDFGKDKTVYTIGMFHSLEAHCKEVVVVQSLFQFGNSMRVIGYC